MSLCQATSIFSTDYAFAALKTDGSVQTWGDSTKGGWSSVVASLTNVTTIFSNKEAFAALKTDGSVIAWGTSDKGGTAPSDLTNVQSIFSADYAFAALKTDGSVVVWGGEVQGGCNSGSGQNFYSCKPADLTNVQTIVSSTSAFAALRNDGSVVAWGHFNNGGEANSVELTNVKSIFSTDSAFAALKDDGSVVVWGNDGGTDPGDLAVTVGAPSPTQNRICEACPVGKYSNDSNAGSCKPWKTPESCNEGLEYTPGTTTTDAMCTEPDPFDDNKRTDMGMDKTQTDDIISVYQGAQNGQKLTIAADKGIRSVANDSPDKQRKRLKEFSRLGFADGTVIEFRFEKKDIPTGMFKNEARIREVRVFRTNQKHVLAKIEKSKPLYAPLELGENITFEINGEDYNFEQTDENTIQITWPNEETENLSVGATLKKSGLIITGGSVAIEQNDDECVQFENSVRTCPDILNSYNTLGCCGGATGQCATDVLEYNCAACCS